MRTEWPWHWMKIDRLDEAGTHDLGAFDPEVDMLTPIRTHAIGLKHVEFSSGHALFECSIDSGEIEYAIRISPVTGRGFYPWQIPQIQAVAAAFGLEADDDRD